MREVRMSVSFQNPAPPQEGDGPDFEYEGQPVGHFLFAGPTEDGDARYMPFRGPGHYAMQTARRAGGQPLCSYASTGERIWFQVIACPEYGVLTLRFTPAPGTESPTSDLT